MRRFILLLAILIVSVCIGLKLAEDPGYAIFAYRHWTVEMPLWFVVLGGIVGLIVLFYVVRFFDAINSTWVGWRNWLKLRRKHKAYSKTNRGLIDLLEANWKSAEQSLMQNIDESEAPLINFLAAAKAAHEQGAYTRRDAYLRQAYDLSSDTQVAVGLLQAQLQLDQGKTEQAIATLNQLRQQAPKQTKVLKLLEHAYVRNHDWRGMLKLLPDLHKAKLITVEQMAELECKSYEGLLHNADKAKDVVRIKETWHSLPRSLRKNSDLIVFYVDILSQYDYPKMQTEVAELIEDFLKAHWQADLVFIYGTLKAADAGEQLKMAEGWLKHYGPQPVLYLTLARLSMRCQLWGKARTYYEEVLKKEPTSEAYKEYADLLMQLGDVDSAIKNYRQAVLA